ncbi:MAG: ileS [Ignavibacteria bacterium]|nr:ileS [Ignavibacteria bacterium]
MFQQLPENLSYPELEHKILEFWEENNIFEKSLENRIGQRDFAFFEGPPTVNGKPGLHHMMARALKDTVCRYKTMTGHYVRRQAGWDTHGLPVEIAVEKQLGLKDKNEIESFGVDKFNEECKKFVYKNIEMDQGWRTLTRRMGFWIDLDAAYITCTNNYIESVWWALKQFFDKGLIYKGFKVVPQSPTIATPLSSHELSLGYKDVRDPNVYLKLKIISSPKSSLNGSCILVWTTTPWTLFANVALSVGEKIEYVHVKNTRKTKEEELTDLLVLAKSRISVLDGEVEIIEEFTGKDILGTVYEQILPYVTINRETHTNALTVLPGDFVSTDDGSGVVHLAPAFGEDDYRMSLLFNLPFEQPVTPDGHFTEELGPYAGRAIKTFTYEDHVEEGSDKDIIKDLKYAGKIYRSSIDYLHSYPHCWRTGNPIMYYARDSWFIRSPDYKEIMKQCNNQIFWQPPEIGSGRFGNWLEEVKEWSLSRDRYWGTPLPIWISEDGEDKFAVGSIAELSTGLYEFEDGKRIPVPECGIEIDLHIPFVDKVVFERNGKVYRRISEVIDVWFDSGSMPFAQMHYPFENQDLFEKMFPGDFIAEGIDQTRGWFYTLHNIASALFGKPAFKNILVNELILDKKGEKMSKSKGNTVDPFEIMEKYGADAVRWYLFVNNPPWKATLFNEEDINSTILSGLFRSLINCYAFFSLYANIDGFTGNEPEIPLTKRPEIDRWIISRVNSVLKEYIRWMEEYDLTKSHRAIQSFVIDELSNWYIRRNRRRFWKGGNDSEKIAAYQTLRTIMINILEMMASAAPFLTETLYQRLRLPSEPISIHLIDLPKPDMSKMDVNLERRMDTAQRIVNLTRFLREKSKIKVRQPLRRILVPVLNPQQRRDISSVEEIIIEEINVKAIEFVTDETEGIVKRKAKANFKTLGKKFGKMTQIVANAILNISDSDIRKLESGQQITIDIDSNKYTIEREDIEISSEEIEGWLVASEYGVTVALDTQITTELIHEGIAREFVNRLQNIRKQSGFEVTDRIKILYSAPKNLLDAIEIKKEYIMNETLAESLMITNLTDGMEIEINDGILKINVVKC